MLDRDEKENKFSICKNRKWSKFLVIGYRSIMVFRYDFLLLVMFIIKIRIDGQCKRNGGHMKSASHFPFCQIQKC